MKMQIKYDPDRAPDPERWLALDEGERMALVSDYHRKAGISVPNLMVHSAIHAAVENQIALGDEIPVKGTLHRLMKEGLHRHDAIHAIGSVLAELIYGVLKDELPGTDPNEPYFEALAELTAETWMNS